MNSGEAVRSDSTKVTNGKACIAGHTIEQPGLHSTESCGGTSGGLEVGEDEDEEYYEDIHNPMSIYAPSTYPGAQSSHQSEHTSENGHDGATMFVLPYISSISQYDSHCF